MTTDQKLKLITKNLEEVLVEEELKNLIESDTPLRHYIGFEISGKIHVGHFFQLLKVKDLQEAGAETVIWLADLHSAVNDKLDGRLETIKRLSYDYFVPAMKVLFKCIGGDPEKLIFKLCSQTYAENPQFWMSFIEMGKATTLARSMRSITIMGREASDDSIETAKLMYPIMQAADIFLLQTNIAQAGIDQRKVHVVAREGAMQVKTFPLKNRQGKQIKPIAIHTPILLGLNYKGEETTGEADEVAMKTKMSKSKADSAISVHDSPEEIRTKIYHGFAPEGEIKGNPLLDWTKRLVFYEETATLTIKRDQKYGGEMIYHSFEDLEKDYLDKMLHPMDLKEALCEWLIKKLEPIRVFFQNPQAKQALEEIEQLTNQRTEGK